jgi:hypothetical protein
MGLINCSSNELEACVFQTVNDSKTGLLKNIPVSGCTASKGERYLYPQSGVAASSQNWGVSEVGKHGDFSANSYNGGCTILPYFAEEYCGPFVPPYTELTSEELRSIDKDCQDKQGRAPLHIAVNVGNKDAFAHLIRVEANLTVRDNDGMTVLELLDKSLEEAHTRMKEFLEEREVIADIKEALKNAELRVGTLSKTEEESRVSNRIGRA